MTLRRANWPDIDDVAALNADPEVMRHVDDGRPMSAARVLADEMPRLIADSTRLDQLGVWVARDRATGGFLGWFTTTPLDGSGRTVVLGYRLRRRACRQDYSTEGVRRLIEMARDAHVSTVIATTPAVDTDCRRVLEAAGMRLSRAGVEPAGLPATGEGRVLYVLDLVADDGAGVLELDGTLVRS